MKRILEGLAPLLVLSLGITHCSTDSGESGSQTHWLDGCRADADCGGGLTCECGVCTETCTSSSSCGNLGRSATCVSPASPAQRALCGETPANAICLPSCAAGCESGETCIDGACVPGEVNAPDGGAGGQTGAGGTDAGAGGSASGGGGSGGAGAGGAAPGDDPCVGACCPTDGICYSDPLLGASSPGATCLAEHDNGAGARRIQLRQRWLNVESPPGLALPVVRATLNNYTQLPQPECYSTPAASTGYIQLLDYDLTSGVLETGFATFVPEAAVPSTLADGFCMAERPFPWSHLPEFMGSTLNMPIAAAELYTGAEAGFPAGLVDPMPQPWTARPTRSRRLETDFVLATDRLALLQRLAPGGDLGAQGYSGVFFLDEPTGETHTYAPLTWQVLYDGTPDGFVLLPVRESETRSRFTDPARPNCVGRFRGDVLDRAAGCLPAGSGTGDDQHAWGGVSNTTAGEGDARTEGYFLIVELEQLWSSVVTMSLCVLYPDPTDPGTWGATATPKLCRNDPRWNPKDRVNGLPRGDWCAATNGPATADCHDAYRLRSFHAFAGAKIKDAACPATGSSGPTLCTTMLSGIPTDAGPPAPSCGPYSGSCSAFGCACVGAANPGCTCTQTSDTRIDLVCAAPGAPP